MRHQVRKKRFDRTSSHRIAMFRNMVTSLIEEGRITTTLVKAKMLRSLADKMVTLAKTGTLHARRQAARVVRTPDALRKLFSELGPRFQSRAGGYTRVLHLGFRHGDGAPMALIEYLGFEGRGVSGGKEDKKKAAPKKADKKKEEKKPAAEKKAKPAEAKKEKAEKKEKAPKKEKKEKKAK